MCLHPEHIDELLHFSKAYADSGRDLAKITDPNDFSISSGLKSALQGAREGLLHVNGTGRLLLRGLPGP